MSAPTWPAAAHRWWERRDWALECMMSERGILSSTEVPKCEWDEMVSRAELEAGERPFGTGTPRPTSASNGGSSAD